MTDSRAKEYVKEFGKECWELDALDPTIIRDLIQENINGLRHEPRWREALREEQDAKIGLKLVGAEFAKAVKACTPKPPRKPRKGKKKAP